MPMYNKEGAYGKSFFLNDLTLNHMTENHCYAVLCFNIMWPDVQDSSKFHPTENKPGAFFCEITLNSSLLWVESTV